MRRHQWVLTILTGFAFLIRLFPIRIGLQGWDAVVYMQHAEIIAGLRDNTFNEFHFRPPLLPCLLAPVLKVWNSDVVAHLVVASLSTVGILITYRLGKCLYDRHVGLLAASCVAFNPLHIAASHEILVDSVLPVMWAAVVYLSIKAFLERRPADSVAAGLLLGFSVLLKFSSLLLVAAVPVLFVLYRARRIATWKWKEALWPCFPLMLVSSAAPVVVYLAINKSMFGNPFHPFSTGFALLRLVAPTDWGRILDSLGDFFPYPLYLGIALLVPTCRRWRAAKAALALLIPTVLGVVSILRLPHVELRYFLCVLPFLCVLSARGFRFVAAKLKQRAILTTLIVLALVLSCRFPDRIIRRDSNAALEAGEWLRANAQPNTVIYTNHEWPILAYYSHKPIVLLPFGRPFQHEIGGLLSAEGYVVSSTANAMKQPSFRFLQDDGRFTLVDTWTDGRQSLSLFRYDQPLNAS